MARIEDLINDIQDAKLRKALEVEVKRLKETTDFGLVFERHQPESVLLAASAGLNEGSQVRLRKDPTSKTVFIVKSLTAKTATIEDEDGNETKVPVKDLLLVKGFDEPIFPTLARVGEVSRGDGKRPHLAIEADNFHALEQLCLAYEGQIDLIYIDPPYNTGAKDWKYNNDYVDEHDEWRHSRWLSFMEKRLRLAKRLLTPDGVLVVTIDEHEVANLSVLLAEKDLFGSARRQMVTIVNNAAGVSQGGFFRVEEYALFCFQGNSVPASVADDLLSDEGKAKANPVWFSLIRFGGINALPSKRPGLVYPIAIDPDTLRIAGVGKTLTERTENGEIDGDLDSWRPDPKEKIGGKPVVWPFRGDGSLGTWQLNPQTLLELSKDGFVRVRPHAAGTGTNEYSVSYIKSGNRAKILSGEIPNSGREDGDGPYEIGEVSRLVVPKTVWRRARHDAGKWGSRTLRELLGSVSFDYAKSPYAVLDTLRTVMADKPDGIVLDFFAGSGTTLQATTMLNAEDEGSRRCILVTNNEVDDAKARSLRKEGLFPGDASYEEHGIFEGVMRPRCEAVLTGKNSSGKPIEGEYLDGRKIADGFDEGVEFLSIEYLEPNSVELGEKWAELLPMMWLVAGASGPPPKKLDAGKGYVVASQCGFAVLSDDERFSNLIEEIGDDETIKHIFLLTDSEDAYSEMTSQLPGRTTHMWPRDYLRFFRKIAEERS